MGYKLSIDGKEYHLQGYSVQEAATPLAAGDSSGQVGTLTFSLPKPDPWVDPDNPLHALGPALLEGEEVELQDTSRGVTLAKITSVSHSQESATFEVTATSRLGKLNIYNVQAPPFVGSLGQAFEMYLGLAGVTDRFFVDPSITNTPVALPGWSGELWFNLKQLAAAMQLDVSLVSGVILLRPIRTRDAVVGRDISRNHSLGGSTTAQFVEAYYYNNREIINEMVYPVGGWSPEVATINLNAGEYIEEVLELSASLESVEQPVMQSFVSQLHDSSSVYTVTGDDGLNVDPALWQSRGGYLRVEINPDTRSLTVKIQAPSDLPSSSGVALTSFGISLASEEGTGRYSTLRIRGTGVAFDKQMVRTPTGLTANETGTEVGVTIDNPFLSTFEEVARASAWAVRSYDGSGQTLSGSVSLINNRYDDGSVLLAPYSFDQTLNTGMTYAQVQTAEGGGTYQQNFDKVNGLFPKSYDDQVFGNVNGTRVLDDASMRWYRIRSGTITPDVIQFEAEDDLTHDDATSFYLGKTYGDLQTLLSPYKYRQVDLMGLRK